MVQTYGSKFEKEQWVQSMLQQNREAGQSVSAPPPVPAPRPPSPHIPDMPPFPVAPTIKNPEEYNKYKKDYDAYTDWYNKYAILYAAKQDKKSKGLSSASHSEGSQLPDPNSVPAGVDPVAWRKYCNDTREYYAKYKSQSNMAEESRAGLEGREGLTVKITDKILGSRGTSM